MTDEVQPRRPWLVKYDGTCSKCGTPLLVGAPAVWDRATKTIHCITCPDTTDAEAVSGPAPERSPIDFGHGGGSARREHDRRAAKREADVRDRWGDRVGGWVLRLTAEPQSTRAWAIGARGEELLAEALADIPDVQVLHDRRVPHTQGNIDHLVVAQAGIFVVDAKYWDGIIRIRNVGNVFRRDDRLYVGRRDCSKLARKMSWQVEAVQSALLRSGVDPMPSITPVLCFVDGDWPLFGAPDEFEGVRLESERSIRKLFTATGEIETDAILRLTRALANELPSKAKASR